MKCRELKIEDLGIGGNWGEEEEMGDKFLGKDEKENSKEDRVEIKKLKDKKDRKDEKRRKKTIVPRGGKRRETRKKKIEKKKDT